MPENVWKNVTLRALNWVSSFTQPSSAKRRQTMRTGCDDFDMCAKTPGRTLNKRFDLGININYYHKSKKLFDYALPPMITHSLLWYTERHKTKRRNQELYHHPLSTSVMTWNKALRLEIPSQLSHYDREIIKLCVPARVFCFHVLHVQNDVKLSAPTQDYTTKSYNVWEDLKVGIPALGPYSACLERLLTRSIKLDYPEMTLSYLRNCLTSGTPFK